VPKGKYQLLANTIQESPNLEDSLKQIIEDDKYQLSWFPYNNFENIKKVGQGGFATVYRAEWIDQNRSTSFGFALKLLHGSKEFSKEFITERIVRLVMKIQHF